jgi:hypothetical protein
MQLKIKELKHVLIEFPVNFSGRSNWRVPEKLPGFFDSGMLQLFEIERFLFDRMIPCGREVLQQELATSGARAAHIVFLNAIHSFLRDRAFAPASECYASNAPDIVRSR